MLSKIINIVRTGSILSLESIAAQVGISEEVARVVLDDLVRRGYLQEAKLEDSGCKTPCKGCSGSCRCHSKRTKSWELTGKEETIKVKEKK